MKDKKDELPSKGSNEENHCCQLDPPKQKESWLQKHFPSTFQIKVLVEVTIHNSVLEGFKPIKFLPEFTNNPNWKHNTSKPEQDCKRRLNGNSRWTPRYRFEVDEAANYDLWVAFKHHCDKEIYYQLLSERDSESLNSIIALAALQAEQKE